MNRLGELTDSQGQLLPLSLALRFLHSHLRILHRSVPLPKVLRISSWRFRLFQSPSPLTPGEHTSSHGMDEKRLPDACVIQVFGASAEEIVLQQDMVVCEFNHSA